MADELNKELQDTIQERSLLYTRVALLDKKIRDIELKIRLIGMSEIKSAVKVMTDTWEGAQAASLLNPTIPVVIEEDHVEVPSEIPSSEPPKKEDLTPHPTPAGWFPSLWSSPAQK